MTSPSLRRPRNAKGLALNLSSTPDTSPQQNSAPSSPSFVKPEIPKARKKPSILSLQTSAAAGLQPRLAFDPPPTPGGAIRTTTIRHAHSSPQLLADPMRSSLIGPEGGMQFPQFERSRISGLSSAFRKPSALKESILGSDTIEEEENSPIRTQMATRSQADIRGDSFDVPMSQEDAKSPGYPDGPVMIYEPNVFLFLEPTAEEARKFNTVINVAQEVKNPFKAVKPESPLPLPMDRSWPKFDPMDLDDRDNIPEPDTAVSCATFRTAFESMPNTPRTPYGMSGSSDASSITPKPVDEPQPEPEYIHIPWEHNTDISKDLMGLCETIDNRAKDGKKVLIHCQQGASRSASLIIAYGMYINPELSVNDAYHAAQARSRWISPNMKLMYALQDFQKELEKKKQGGSGYKSRSGRSPTKHRTTLSADAIGFPSKEPQTAPLPSEREMVPRSKSPENSNRTRGLSTPGFGDITPGPSSAPSTFSWNAKFDLSKGKAGGESAQSAAQNAQYGQHGPLSNLAPSRPPPPPPSQFERPATSFGPPTSFSHRNICNIVSLGSVTSPTASDCSSAASPDFFSPATQFAPAPSFRRFPSHLNDEPPPTPSFRRFPSHFNDEPPPTPSLFSPRIQEFTNNPMHSYSPPSSQGLMSPRATEFSLSPFNHAPPSFSLGESLEPPPTADDPRSPATKGDAPIIRSIDELL